MTVFALTTENKLHLTIHGVDGKLMFSIMDLKNPQPVVNGESIDTGEFVRGLAGMVGKDAIIDALKEVELVGKRN